MRKKMNLYPIWIMFPAIILFTVLFILPMIIGIYLSMTNWDFELDTMQFIGLKNYTKIFTDKYYLQSIVQNLIFAASIIVIRNVIGMFLAVTLTKPLKSRNYLRTVFYLPSVLSYIVVGILFTALLRSNGMVNQLLNTLGIGSIDWLGNSSLALLSVILLDVWMWTGFHMIIYIAGLQGVSSDYYEASMIDGASGFKQFLYVTMPLMAPAFRISATISLLGGFRVFEQVFVLTNGGPGYATTTISLMVYRTFSSGMFGKATAMEMTLSLFIFLMSLLVSKFFSKRELEL